MSISIYIQDYYKSTNIILIYEFFKSLHIKKKNYYTRSIFHRTSTHTYSYIPYPSHSFLLYTDNSCFVYFHINMRDRILKSFFICEFIFSRQIKKKNTEEKLCKERKQQMNSIEFGCQKRNNYFVYICMFLCVCVCVSNVLYIQHQKIYTQSTHLFQ